MITDIASIMMQERADEHFTKAAWCKAYIDEMRSIVVKKLDEATSYVLKVKKKKIRQKKWVQIVDR